MVMMNPDICEWKNKRITVTDEEKCVKECYCSVRNISKNEYYNCFYLSKGVF